MAEISLPPSRLLIDPRAHSISDADRAWERDADLLASIGSTGSGTGAAVMSRLARNSDGLPTARQAADVPELTQFISDTVAACLQILKRGDRVLIEGTQGFGLSPLHGDYWPHVTSRDTTAAAFISEAGLSPLDVDDVTLVFRAFPIRVGGNSGPLPNEITWEHIRYAAGSPIDLTEHTSVTKKVRRVAEFDFQLAKRAVAINQPTRVIMNHLDHVDWACRAAGVTARGWEYIRHVEKGLGRNVDWVGTGESCFAELSPSVALRA
jgi:adenylosuccinate synthase